MAETSTSPQNAAGAGSQQSVDLEWLLSSERPLFGIAAGLFGSAAAFQILGWRWLATLAGKLAPLALVGALGIRGWSLLKGSSAAR
jgi:hypothetical protein